MTKNLKILLPILVVLLVSSITFYLYEKKTIEIEESMAPDMIVHHHTKANSSSTTTKQTVSKKNSVSNQ